MMSLGPASVIAAQLRWGVRSAFTAACFVGWVVFLVTLWRTMRAHETLAAAIKKIAERQERP